MNHAGNGNGKVGAVAVVGAGIAGMQASLDLAEAGFKVHLIERLSAIGGRMAQLDKTFPTNDCAMCTISPRLVECDKHLNIDILTNAEVMGIDGEAGAFTLSLLKHPRYVDAEKCNACGDCEEVCPVLLPDAHDEGLDRRKVIHKRYPQAIPNAYAIDKGLRPPCRLTCPAGVNVQGYVALIGRGKFREAVDLIRERHPLPGVCGRICHHPCEFKCNRREIDEGVAVNALKRFAADWVKKQKETEKGESEKRSTPFPPSPRNGERESRRNGEDFFAGSPVLRLSDSGGGRGRAVPGSLVPRLPGSGGAQGKVAVVGSGPAGLTCASDLARMGYAVTIFEAAPVPGGMLRMGIPAYRLPKEVLQAEIDDLLAEGIDLKLNTPIGPDLTLDHLRLGYRAIFLAVGAQKSRMLSLPGANLDGVLPGLDFLRDVNLGRPVKVGRRTVVIGGGNVAVDVAQTALRLGAEEVHLVCLESRGEMPAHAWEVEDALEEKIVLHCSRGPKRFVGEEGRVTGLETLDCASVFDADGRFNPKLVEGTESVLPADTVIVAIGQASDFSFLGKDEPLKVTRRGTLEVDDLTLETSAPGVFAGGDAVKGPASAVDAVAQGHEAAVSIHRYLSGLNLKLGRERREQQAAGVPSWDFDRSPRQVMPRRSAEERAGGFAEIELGFTEEQAVAEARRCLSCGLCSECLQCVKACQPGAIDHEAQPEAADLRVGAVILAAGFERFDARLRGEYGYGRYPNVVTSLAYERILSASGPTAGKVQRPSDGGTPRRIAWIQCVGSRDAACGAPYCSSVCCMAATKEAVMTREHDPEVETTIFYNDIRAFGKGFERYYEAAKKERGVRYVRGIPSAVKELQRSKNLLLRHTLDDGSAHEEEFDLVVLSVGMTPAAEAKETAQRLGVELNPYGFVKTGRFAPNLTSRPGVFACGALEEPMDIPEAVTAASSAAALAGELLAGARGTLVQRKTYPSEQDVSGEEPRVGVFVCHCGSNIARTVDVEAVVAHAKDLPGVAHAEHNLYTCSTDAQRKIIDTIRAHGLNRVVVSSCTPRTHEPLFQDMMREAGLNPYLFEMANIRDQCSWVHAEVPDRATEKAKDLMRMAVARARTLEAMSDRAFEIRRRGLVIGGGLAGMTAALALAEQGFETVLIEKEKELGGRLRQMYYTLDGEDPQEMLRDLMERVLDHPLITVHLDADVVGFSGHVGDFKTRILTGGREVEVEHGALIVATGGVEHRPDEYLCGEDPRVMTQTDFEAYLSGDGVMFAPPKDVVMIQCVGSREEGHMYCSRVCCASAIKNALRLKRMNPDSNVVVFHRDVRTYGFNELHYRAAREAGVLFVRYELDARPVVEAKDGKLRVTGFDPVLGANIEIEPDLVVLSSAVRPHPEAAELAPMFKVPTNEDGFFLEAHLKLRPVDFANEGMFLCGLAHSPKLVHETVAQARAAAARAATILSKERLSVGGIIARVDEEKCAACLTCVRTCPFDIPIIRDGAAFIEATLCQGCGTCATACPARAIEVGHYKDEQILAKVESLYP